MHSGQKNNHHMISEMEKSRKRQIGGEIYEGTINERAIGDRVFLNGIQKQYENNINQSCSCF